MAERLRNLDAQFLHQVTTVSQRRTLSDSVEGAQGIMFQCPSCGAGMERGEEDGRGYIKGAHYITVLFANPRGTEAAPPTAGPVDGNGNHPRWTMSGNTIDDLSLAPSVDCSRPWKGPDGVTHPSGCNYHSFVTNGAA